MLRRGARIGRYRIESLLAQGAMGQIHIALDEQLRRKVAIKTIFVEGEVAAPVALRERFLREARAAAALTHVNAVAVHEVGEHKGTPFIVMELVEGSTLRAYVSGADGDVATKVRWMRDVADVLAAAHRLGLVHRDVKPENVMVRRDGVVKVLDFGVAKRMRPAGPDVTEKSLELTADGTVLGTPKYMSPESFEGVVSPAMDQFAWGLVTYELLAGDPPFVPRAGMSHYEAILCNEPAPIGGRVAGLSEPIARAVMQAIAKRVDHRFPSMDALVAALDVGLARSVRRDGTA